RRLGGAGGARGRAGRARAGAGRLRAALPRRAGAARPRGERALRLPGRLPRALLREAALLVRPPGAGRLLHLPGDGARRGRARPRARAPFRPLRGARVTSPALRGARLTSSRGGDPRCRSSRPPWLVTDCHLARGWAATVTAAYGLQMD